MSLLSYNSWLYAGAIALGTTLPALSWAKSPSIDDRLTRIETIIENERSFELMNQLDAMQQEIRELRGKIEEQQNEIILLSKKQDKLFLNLDSRMNSLPTSPSSLVPQEQQPDTQPELILGD